MQSVLLFQLLTPGGSLVLIPRLLGQRESINAASTGIQRKICLTEIPALGIHLRLQSLSTGSA